MITILSQVKIYFHRHKSFYVSFVPLMFVSSKSAFLYSQINTRVPASSLKHLQLNVQFNFRHTAFIVCIQCTHSQIHVQIIAFSSTSSYKIQPLLVWCVTVYCLYLYTSQLFRKVVMKYINVLGYKVIELTVQPIQINAQQLALQLFQAGYFSLLLL